MFDLLESALVGGDFLELRYHDRRSRSVTVEDGRVEGARSTRHAGIGVRALVNGAWGFASTSVLTKAALARAVDDARAAARSAARNKRERVDFLPPVHLANGRFQSEAIRPLEAMSFEEKIEKVLEADRLAKSASSKINSSSARYVELIDEKMVLIRDPSRP